MPFHWTDGKSLLPTRTGRWNSVPNKCACAHNPRAVSTPSVCVTTTVKNYCTCAHVLLTLSWLLLVNRGCCNIEPTWSRIYQRNCQLHCRSTSCHKTRQHEKTTKRIILPDGNSSYHLRVCMTPQKWICWQTSSSSLHEHDYHTSHACSVLADSHACSVLADSASDVTIGIKTCIAVLSQALLCHWILDT